MVAGIVGGVLSMFEIVSASAYGDLLAAEPVLWEARSATRVSAYRFTAAGGVVALRGVEVSNIPVSAITFSISSISMGTNADRFS